MAFYNIQLISSIWYKFINRLLQKSNLYDDIFL